MKKTLICAIFGALAAMSAPSIYAEETPYPLTLCYGETAKDNKIKFDLTDSDVSAAIYIADSYAATVAGDQLTQVRVALNTKLRIQEVTAWVREDLNGENLAEVTVPIKEMTKGWNDLTLATPYNITGKGFYIGFTYHQNSSTKALLNLDRPGTQSLLLKGGDGEWEDRSAEGTLCIEGLAVGSVRPAVNAALVSASMPQYFILSNADITGKLEVRNLGTDNISSLDVLLESDGVESKEVHLEANIPYGTSAMLPVSTDFGIDTTEPVNRVVKFTITKVSGVDDPDMSNNSYNQTFEVKESGYNRRVLVEEFTTERCPNCPRVAGYLHDILATGDYPNVEVICHHSGYYEDFLTTAADREYTWFYGSGGTYAPAMMFDRVPIDGAVPFFPSYAEDISTQIEKRLNVISVAKVDVACNKPKDDNVLKVDVKCERVDENSLASNARLTLFITEDNIPAVNQSGSEGEYIHQHVTRDVNKIWGQEIKWDGLKYEYSYTFNLNSSWNKDNLKVIAVIGQFDNNNYMNCPVENCAAMNVMDGSEDSGVETIDGTAADAVIVSIYDLCGNRLSELTHGINIVRYSDGTTRKVMVK